MFLSLYDRMHKSLGLGLRMVAEEGGREQSDGGSIDDAQPAGSTKERMAAAAAPECVKGTQCKCSHIIICGACVY